MTSANFVASILALLLTSEIFVRCDTGCAVAPTAKQIADNPYKPRSERVTASARRRRDIWKRENFEDRYTLKDALERYPNCPSIGQIWNQGECAVCYAIAAMAIYTDRMCTANGGASNTFYSASQAVACTHPARTPSKACSMRGTVIDVLNHVVTEGVASGGRFITDDGCVPYGTENTAPPSGKVAPITCRKKCVKAGDNMARETSSADYAWVKYLAEATPENLKKTEKFIKDEVFAEGPVAVGIKVYSSFVKWNFERDGPYSSQSAASGVEELGDHAVKIVGWDKWIDPVASKAQDKTVKVPYWIVANSYGTGHQMDGFAWIKMGENAVGVETYIHGIRIHVDNPMLDKPVTCKSTDFNSDALFDLGVPVDATDTTAPFQLIKGRCTQKMRSTKDGIAKTGPALPVEYVFRNAPQGRLTRYQLTDAARRIQYFHSEAPDTPFTNPDKPIGFPQHEAQVLLYNDMGEAALCKRITDDKFICEDTKVPLAAPYDANPTAAYYTEDGNLNSWRMDPRSPTEFRHNHYALTGMQIHQTDIVASVKGVALFNDLDSLFTLIYLEYGRFVVLGQKKDKSAMNGLLTYESSNPFVKDTPTNIKLNALVIA